MEYMHDLKDLLCAELEEYAEKGKKSGKMSAADLDGIHKLTDTVKNIMKISVLEEEMEGGYSEDSNWMGEGRMYGTSYEGGSSYARGGRGRGRNARRDSMGRYSREGRGGGYSQEGGRGGNHVGGGRGGNRGGGYSRDDGKEYMIEQLEEMMEEAEKPAEREALKRCMQALERA